jgi:hypothetical protein
MQVCSEPREVAAIQEEMDKLPITFDITQNLLSNRWVKRRIVKIKIYDKN